MNEQPYKTVTPFDRARGAMIGTAGVTSSQETTRSTITPITGESQTFIVQTCRMRDIGETIFLQHADESGRLSRIAIPPEVARVIYSQRDALAARVRRDHGRRIGREQAALRKAQGLPPAFMKGKKKKR